MWNLLRRIIGNSSASQERLMAGQDPNVVITDEQLEKAIDLLEPLKLPAYPLPIKETTTSKSLIDHKGKELPLYKTILHPEFKIELYLREKDFYKHESYLQGLIIDGHHKIPTNSYSSLPIWESLIHIDLDKHRRIVEFLPNHPWSLYKEAKLRIENHQIKDQLSGYPQWLINDIDFRKLKHLQFLFQLEVTSTDQMIYCFKELSSSNLQFFLQKR